MSLTSSQPRRRPGARIVGVAAIIAAALTACGGPDDPAADSSATAPTTAASTTTSPPQAPVSTGTATTGQAFAPLRGEPTSIVIHRAGAEVGRADIDATTAPDGVLTSTPGRAAWYASPGWPKPGTSSTNRAIVVAHVRWDGKPDVFGRLAELRRGDRVSIGYSSGDDASFEVSRDPVAVSKVAVIADGSSTYRWVWRGTTASRTLSLISCDLESGEGSDGHLLGNVVVQAERVR